MDFAKLCISCMKERDQGQNLCPHCHFEQTSYIPPSYVLPPYSILKGRYMVGKILGKGGFGITYIAMDLVLERVVAIKEFYIQEYMHRDGSSSASVSITVTNNREGDRERDHFLYNLKKFEKEAKIIANLEDLSGIVKVYDFFHENDTSYIVMEFLDGINLKQYVKNHGGSLSVEEVVEKLFTVMESLQRLHENHIIHRDISADNIMVLEGGDLRLLDFGGAKVEASNNVSSMVIAKKGYTPIEQYFVDGNQGPWTDVYAMAATIYYCICGKVPPEAVNRIEHDEIWKPSKMGVSISENMEKVLMKALSVKRQERYQSMAEFSAALQNADVARKETIQDPQPGLQHGVDPQPAPPDEGKPKRQSNKIVMAVAAVATVLIVLVVGLTIGRNSSKPIINAESVPQRLDKSTVFTEATPLVLSGANLQKIDSIYIDNQKVEDLTILEKSENEVKLAFSMPETRKDGMVKLRAEAHVFGLLSSPSKNMEIEVYDSGAETPEIDSLEKNGKEIQREAIRLTEPFVLGVEGSTIDIDEDYVVVVNGNHVESAEKNGKIEIKVEQDLLDGIVEEEKMDVQVAAKTEEGYESSHLSNVISMEVDNQLIDNDWLSQLNDDHFQIVDFDEGLTNSSEAVSNKIGELYNQGTHFLRYTPKNNVDLSYVLEELKKREDLYLILYPEGESEMESCYSEVKAFCEKTDVSDRVVAMLGSGDDIAQWSSINKIQDALRIVFQADQADMTYQQLLKYWKEHNIKAVSFNTESYWYSALFRNKEDIKKQEISFICEDLENPMEIYYMLHPEKFEWGLEESKQFEGVKGVIANPDVFKTYRNSSDQIKTASTLSNMANGTSAKEYLSYLKNTGFTVIAAIKDDGKEIENIADELDALGLHSSVIGGENAFRQSYIAVVKTRKDSSNELIAEKNMSSSKGGVLEYDYKAGKRTFHIASYGNSDEKNASEPIAEISCNGANYACNESGINFVVYDEKNDCIVDRVWFATWDNQKETNPPISKINGCEWIMLHYNSEKNTRKEKIIDYFNDLGKNMDDQIVIISIGDEGASNMDSDIKEAMETIGITAPFEKGEGFQKSYIGVFGKDLGKLDFSRGANDEFSESKVSLPEFQVDDTEFEIYSEGHGIESSLAQIIMDGEEMTNGLRGMHILVYDKEKHQATNYTWIDSYDNLKFYSVDIN